jgi:hypothetical protein
MSSHPSPHPHEIRQYVSRPASIVRIRAGRRPHWEQTSRTSPIIVRPASNVLAAGQAWGAGGGDRGPGRTVAPSPYDSAVGSRTARQSVIRLVWFQFSSSFSWPPPEFAVGSCSGGAVFGRSMRRRQVRCLVAFRGAGAVWGRRLRCPFAASCACAPPRGVRHRPNGRIAGPIRLSARAVALP